MRERMTMRLEMGNLSTDPIQRLEMKLSPPIAATIDEAVSNAVGTSEPVSAELVALVKDYVSSENVATPYADSQIVEYAQTRGYDVSRIEIARARKALGIKPSVERSE